MSDFGLESLLKTTEPLGPERHEKINMRLGGHHSNILVFKTALFDRITQSRRPIIAGRRGSGKTAVVNALVASSSGEPYSWGAGEIDLEARNIVVFLDSYKRFDILVEKVSADLSQITDDWTSVRPETSARYWAKHLWNEVFSEIYERDIVDNHDFDHIPHLCKINKIITGKDVSSKSAPISFHAIDEAFREAQLATISYLEDNDLNCVVVVDSFEVYPLKSPRFEKVISGFFRCVNDFADMYDRCFVYCCMPEEIEPILRDSIPNIITDGSEDTSLSRLRWRPIDLLGVVAKRYKEFLKIHLPQQESENRDFLSKIVKLNVDDRDDLNEFFKMIIPEKLLNRYGCEEPTLAYIIRHTQLLPREMLSLFSSAILTAHDRTGSWISIDASDIVKAIDKKEEDFAKQTLKPFRVNYPTLCQEVPNLFARLGIRPTFTGRELDSFKSIEGIASADTPRAWNTLFEMGVIGYIEDVPNTASLNDTYVYGRFHYNSNRRIAISKDGVYCVHPIFSGTWHLRNQETCKDVKYVYPADVPFDLLGS